MAGIPSIRSLIDLVEGVVVDEQKGLSRLDPVCNVGDQHSAEDDLMIDVNEGKNNRPNDAMPPREWKIVTSDIFAQSVSDTRRTFPDIDEKLKKFVDTKLRDPLDPSNRYGKHDRPMTAAMSGFLHCHLRDDAVLIYTLSKSNVNLIAIVTHSELEGKRLHKTAKRLRANVDAH